MSETLYTLKEAAQMLRVSKSWLYANKDRLPHHLLGGIKFSESDFNQILEESKTKTQERDQRQVKVQRPRPRVRLKHVKL